jgi:hypothetical protein
MTDSTCHVCQHHKAAHDRRGCTFTVVGPKDATECPCTQPYDFAMPAPLLPPEKPKPVKKRRGQPIPPPPPPRGSKQRQYMTGKFDRQHRKDWE